MRATREHWAVPHFNVSDLDQLRGVVLAAAELHSPLMIGVSEGERSFIGLKQAVALIKAYREEFRISLFLNADHSRSVQTAKAAIDAGFDSVHIDLSRETDEKNFTGTAAVVAYAKKKKTTANIEGELGYLVTESSTVYRKSITVPLESLTKPEEAMKFVRATGINRFAPAVGNLHGIAANRPKLDFKRIATIREKLPSRVTLVLHGGSGNAAMAFKRAIVAGIGNIHISTQLRITDSVAHREAIKQNPRELAPYKLAEPVVDAIKKEADRFIKIFGANDRI